MINTRFYFELHCEANNRSATFAKNVEMSYRITDGELISVDDSLRDNEGAQFDMTVSSTYFNLSTGELIVSLGTVHEGAPYFDDSMAFFLADGWKF